MTWVPRILAAILLAVALSCESAAQSASVVPPSDTQYVASSQGRVYYWVECRAWRSLVPENLVFFDSREEAEAVGYTPSQSEGCAGPGLELLGPSASGSPARSPASLAPGSRHACRVERIVDGDNLVCAGFGSVRLLLIDTPEMDQVPFGSAARAGLAGLSPPGTDVVLEIDVDPTDQYDRVLAYVHLSDGRIVNEELLRAGVAIVSVYAPNVRHVDRFRAVAEEARVARRGLWAQDAFACLPADHRAGRC